MINWNYKMGLLPFEKKKRKIIVKKETEIKTEERTLKEMIEYGIIVINKPAGPSSHQVSDYVKKILEINKAGHSGTLDPNVTGVLPVALGRATRIAQALLKAGKEYVCLMHLHEEISREKLEKIMQSFTGKIKQLPPVKSAIKRQIRERTIYYIEILDIKEQDVLFKVGCEAGTYIRKLCHDIGEKLGFGAHMSELIRTKAGPFDESQMVTLQDLADAYHYYKKGKETELRKMIMPIEKGIEHLPKIWVLDTTVDSLCHGATLHMPGIAKLETGIKPEDTVAILTLKNELVATGKAKRKSEDIQKKQKGIAFKSDQVFMQPGTYPK
jgi:H/ACA ribonucleoprotein complex subunit 4